MNGISGPIACNQGQIDTGAGTITVTQPCSNPQPDCPQRPSGPGTSTIVNPTTVGPIQTPGVDYTVAKK